MWRRCICGTEESHASSEALSCRSTTGRYLAAGLSEQLAQYEQLVMQLIDQHLDKKTQLQVRGEHLKVTSIPVEYLLPLLSELLQ